MLPLLRPVWCSSGTLMGLPAEQHPEHMACGARLVAEGVGHLGSQVVGLEQRCAVPPDCQLHQPGACAAVQSFSGFRVVVMLSPTNPRILHTPLRHSNPLQGYSVAVQATAAPDNLKQAPCCAGVVRGRSVHCTRGGRGAPAGWRWMKSVRSYATPR